MTTFALIALSTLAAWGIVLLLAGAISAGTARWSDYPGSPRNGLAMIGTGAGLFLIACWGLSI